MKCFGMGQELLFFDDRSMFSRYLLSDFLNWTFERIEERFVDGNLVDVIRRNEIESLSFQIIFPTDLLSEVCLLSLEDRRKKLRSTIQGEKGVWVMHHFSFERESRSDSSPCRMISPVILSFFSAETIVSMFFDQLTKSIGFVQLGERMTRHQMFVEKIYLEESLRTLIDGNNERMEFDPMKEITLRRASLPL